MSERRTLMDPIVGQIVHYKLRKEDTEAYLKARDEYDPSQVDRRGHPLDVGQIAPLIITRVWTSEGHPKPLVNGRVVLDGMITGWAQNVKLGDELGQWQWPPPGV